jgi:hypothetical protein
VIIPLNKMMPSLKNKLNYYMKFKLIKPILFAFLFTAASHQVIAQNDDMFADLDKDKTPKVQYVINAFKSSRVINGHSMEFIGKGVLDTRILHRFGAMNNGIKDLFGLDYANMRMGFDYGVTKDLTVGVGRTAKPDKELDGFVKYRILHQNIGGKRPLPVSLVWVSGATLITREWQVQNKDVALKSRLAYYHQMIIGRKFNERFSAQVSPTVVHKNMVEGKDDKNNIFSVGLGARIKLSRRVAFVTDYYYIMRPSVDASSTAKAQFDQMKNPLAIGFDIETGGHVFQLHFTNSDGMNEKAFITETSRTWVKQNLNRAQVSFGFNLSRVFTIKQK